MALPPPARLLPKEGAWLMRIQRPGGPSCQAQLLNIHRVHRVLGNFAAQKKLSKGAQPYVREIVGMLKFDIVYEGVLHQRLKLCDLSKLGALPRRPSHRGRGLLKCLYLRETMYVRAGQPPLPIDTNMQEVLKAIYLNLCQS